MKLVDILARELKVWSEGFSEKVGQCINGRLHGYFGNGHPNCQVTNRPFTLCSDFQNDTVTRAEWQAAVDALKVAEGIADAEAGNLIPLDDVKSKYVEYSPAMHAQRVGRVTRVASQPALGDSREQFEQAYSEDNAVPVSFLMTCRQGDSYSVPKVARAWYWWKRARAGVVVVLPETPNRGIGYGLFDAGKEACREAIEAAGVKVAGHDALTVAPFKIITLPPSLADHPARNALDDALAKVGVKVAT